MQLRRRVELHNNPSANGEPEIPNDANGHEKDGDKDATLLRHEVHCEVVDEAHCASISLTVISFSPVCPALTRVQI